MDVTTGDRMLRKSLADGCGSVWTAVIALPDGMRVVVHSGPDVHRRYVYTVRWMSNYHPGDPRGEYRKAERGQVFHAPLPEGLDKC